MARSSRSARRRARRLVRLVRQPPVDLLARAPDLRQALLELPRGVRRRRAGRVEEADAIGEAVELDGHLRPPVPLLRGDQPVPHLPGPGQEPIEAGAGVEQDEPVIEAPGGLAMVARREVEPALLELAHRVGEAAIGREPGDEPRRGEAQQGRHDRPRPAPGRRDGADATWSSAPARLRFATPIKGRSSRCLRRSSANAAASG